MRIGLGRPDCQLRGTDSLAGQHSEREFQRGLHQSRRRSVHHLAEQTAGKIPIDGRWPEELSVIEDVERLHPELQSL